MRRILRVVALLAAGLLLLLAPSAGASVTPMPGQRLPVGSELTGPCDGTVVPERPLDADMPIGVRVNGGSSFDLGTHVSIATPGGWSEVGRRTWGRNIDLATGLPVPGFSCVAWSLAVADKIVVDEPGHYQMAVRRTDWDNVWNGSAWVEENLRHSETAVEFDVVAPQKLCRGRQYRVTKVWTASGTDQGLTGSQLAAGQKLTAAENTELSLGDGSQIRLAKGTDLQVSCDWRKTSSSFTFTLLLGKVWATVEKVIGASGPEIRTAGAVTGVRGTSYWVSYDRAAKRTTVHVTKGRVWVRGRSGHRRTLVLKAGQTAVQVGKAAPRLRTR